MNKGLARAAAITLLLLVCVDLGIPSLCSAESIPQLGPIEAEGWRPAPTDPVDPPQPLLGEDDCFCCCSHIRPQKMVQVVQELGVLPERAQSSDLIVPDIVPHTIFHPPQI